MRFLVYFLSLFPLFASANTRDNDSTVRLAKSESFQIMRPWEERLHKTILNGSLAAQNGEAKRFTVKLVVHNEEGGSNQCSGVIVSYNLVMTAGHCFTDKTASVTVQFGLGGEYGFTHELESSDFKSLFMGKYSRPDNQKTDKGDYLSYDRVNQTQFFKNIKYRRSLVNLAGRISYNQFFDIALIKISQLPEGYSPIKLFDGKALDFNQSVYAAGFGMNDRYYDKYDGALRWLKGNVISHYTKEGEAAIAFESYSPKKDENACLGDSGGPVFVKNASTNEFELLGIISSTTNNCAESFFSINIRYFADWVRKSVAELNAETNI